MKSLPRLVLVAAFAPAAFSQSVLNTFDGESFDDRFGSSVSGAGDVNGDGFADLIVGAYAVDNNGHWSGTARVFSGLDGSRLYKFDGDSEDDLFGWSVSGAGDVNGDGFADMIVGARGKYARVFSGVDGSILYEFHGTQRENGLGTSVSGAGDVNGDGFDDLIVGVYGDSTTVYLSGSALVYSGMDGSILYKLHGDKPEKDDRFGWSVSGAGDVDGDGLADLIVGAIGDSPHGLLSGSARVFSGVDGSALYTFDGDSKFDEFGFSVSGAGDVNGDGFDDLIVGALVDDNNGDGSGSARVFSGLDGSVLYTLDGDSPADLFGITVSAAGDVNGDGFDDIVVGAKWDDNNGKNSGSARVFSGIDGSILYTFDGDSDHDEFGTSVSAAGDVNGDGFGDIVVGAPWDDNIAHASGSARVLSGCDVLGTSYCTPAVANSSRRSAKMGACGSDLADGGYFMLHATDLPAGKFGYFLASDTPGFVANPSGSQGNLCLGGQIGRFAKQIQNSGQNGKLSTRVDLTSIPTTPPHTVMAGETWNFQAWFRDLNPGPTSNFTNAVSVLFK